MSATNGEALSLEQLREKKDKLRLEIQIKMLEGREKSIVRSTRIAEAFDNSWVYAYAGLLDQFRREPINSINTTQDRRGGRNFPFFISETDLNLYRAPARILCGANSYAIGLLSGLTSYVVGEGYNYECTERGAKAGTKRDKDAAKDPLITLCQDVWDEFAESCNWWDLEQELFWRDREDGESFLLHGYDEDHELTWVRTVEPEQVYLPTSLPNWLYGVDDDHALYRAFSKYIGCYGTMSWQDWITRPESSQFGVFTDPEDVQTRIGYAVHHFLNPAEWEFHGVKDLVQSKINTKRSIKRGLTDFAFSVQDALETADKLRHNLAVGAAVQASFAGIRQWETASVQQVQAFQAATTTRQAVGPGGQTNSQVNAPAGAIYDVPKGMQFVNPPGSDAGGMSARVEILQACLRGASIRWNAPEWLGSGLHDTSSFASSLTAESPFVKWTLREQKRIKALRQRTWRIVIRNAVAAGRLPEDTLMRIMPKVEAPQVAVRDLLQQAQTDQIYASMGEKSLKTISLEQGRDYDEEQANIAEFQQDHPQSVELELPPDSPMGSPGSGAPGVKPPPKGGEKPPAPATPKPEGDERHLREGWIKIPAGVLALLEE